MSYAAEIARSIKRYDPSEKAALREFQRTYFGADSRQSDDAFAEWLFERNPNRDPAGPSLWLCERDGAVVGQQGSIPVVLKVGESEHPAAWLIDWMVRPDWRLKGVAPALIAAYVNSTEIAFGLSLEELSYRTVRRSGWQDVGKMSLFVKALDPQACAKVLNLSPVLAKLAPRVLVGGSAYLIGRIAGAVSGLSIEPIAAFDERVDGVWATASPEYAIVVKRDLANLRWRFDDGPHQPLYERYYFKRKGRVIGYAVIRVANWRGHLIGRVIDYFAERRSLAPLLALIIGELNTKGVIAVFVEQCYVGSEAALRSLGCLSVGAANRQRFMFKLRDNASPLVNKLGQVDNWFITAGDADFDHNLIASESPRLTTTLASPSP